MGKLSKARRACRQVPRKYRRKVVKKLKRKMSR